jgi:methylenetetrahydrofolate--tRNA-(uracil-5-)-methyltransferase
MRGMKEKIITVIGGGLAGSEAAWQAASRGATVRLYEMRPDRATAVHRTGDLAELVCSNSFKSLDPLNAHGLLKTEMDRFGSLILNCARETRVPAGAALAVDRDTFPQAVTRELQSHPNITVIREEVQAIPEDGIVIVAVGPLVSAAMAEAIARFTGQEHLYFYDAIAPVIETDSIDREIVFAASRYDKGDGNDYLNCPMNPEEYDRFLEALLAGEKAELHDLDKTPFFEGCLPIEVMASRGRDTIRFGPMKPVGLTDPRTGRWPHAVVQLRQDNIAAEHYSMVGFQTQLKWPAQKEVFRLIPGLEKASFVRLGQIHRNCYINSPTVLLPTLQARSRPTLLFAGQISGVEGYTESTAGGLVAGINAARIAAGREPVVLPEETMIGSLLRYITSADPKGYQPTNSAFGLLPPAPAGVRKKADRKRARSERALEALDRWLAEAGL